MRKMRYKNRCVKISYLQRVSSSFGSYPYSSSGGDDSSDNGAQQASYDAAHGAPKCSFGSSCNSGTQLHTIAPRKIPTCASKLVRLNTHLSDAYDYLERERLIVSFSTAFVYSSSILYIYSPTIYIIKQATPLPTISTTLSTQHSITPTSTIIYTLLLQMTTSIKWNDQTSHVFSRIRT